MLIRFVTPLRTISEQRLFCGLKMYVYGNKVVLYRNVLEKYLVTTQWYVNYIQPCPRSKMVMGICLCKHA